MTFLKENNRYKNVDIESFSNGFEELEDIINSKLYESDDEFCSIAVFCKRDGASELLKDFIFNGYDISYANFDNIDWMQKNTIYYITVSKDYTIGIEPAYSEEGKLMGFDDSISYVYMEDCKQDIVENCIQNSEKVVLFDFEGDEGFKAEEEGLEDEEDDGEDNSLYKHKTSSVSVSKSDDSIPQCVLGSYTRSDDDGYLSYSYSFFSDNLDLLEEITDALDIDLYE